MQDPVTGDPKPLTPPEVELNRSRYGSNELIVPGYHWLKTLTSIWKEPMFLLLTAAAIIYLVAGETAEALFLAGALVFIAAIHFFQEHRSGKALEVLNAISATRALVIRSTGELNLPAGEIVVNDIVRIHEGLIVPADGIILQSGDLQINESILTGESMPVRKGQDQRLVYRGTTVVAGFAVIHITSVGTQTRFGQLGLQITETASGASPLKQRIDAFVRGMALLGGVCFLVVWGLHVARSHDWLGGLLHALTLAMSILPEEIPVAFTTFMALGSLHLIRQGILVKQLHTVEALGSATTICVDKTGTLTQNRMSVVDVFLPAENDSAVPDQALRQQVLFMAMLASEHPPFDPMEQAIESALDPELLAQRGKWSVLQEYELGGNPPMMTHVYRNEQGETVIASKGAPEAYLRLNTAAHEEGMRAKVEVALLQFASSGYRVLAIARGRHNLPLPPTQQEIPFELLGLVAFSDPLKPEIPGVFADFYRAGIKLRMITGDNAQTAQAIGKQAGMFQADRVITGADIMAMSPEQLRGAVEEYTLFARMFPEAKLRVIRQLMENGEVVAMTGDGVNDGPALKAAHIGIAMGKGSETARQAAGLILLDGSLRSMVAAIESGRKIYSNLRKAIQYIISIHIPIILTVLLPLLLGWIYPVIFTPAHVIFLEIIMGPTCSIVYEREPIEPHLMNQKPVSPGRAFFSRQEILQSVLQGLVITLFIMLIYNYGVYINLSEGEVRSLVFIALVTANIGLTLVNRSFHYSVIHTLTYRNNLVPIMIVATLGLTLSLLFIPVLREFFRFGRVLPANAVMAVLAGLISVLWIEVYKGWRRRNTNQTTLLS